MSFADGFVFWLAKAVAEVAVWGGVLAIAFVAFLAYGALVGGGRGG